VADAVVDSPILNGPHDPPTRHWRFDDAGSPTRSSRAGAPAANPSNKTEKVRTARDLWVPAVNVHGGFGRWRFVEVKDPYDCR
jgi:hypothetical protein